MKIRSNIKKAIGAYNEPDYEYPKEFKKLANSILYRAILDRTIKPNVSKFNAEYARIKLRDIEAARECAFDWFKSDDEGGKVHFSFLQVCSILGLSPSTIRKALDDVESGKIEAFARTRRS